MNINPLVKLTPGDKERIDVIADLVTQEPIRGGFGIDNFNGDTIYDAILDEDEKDNGIIFVGSGDDEWDLESWYDSCGENCYGGDPDDFDRLDDHDAHELRMKVKDCIFDLIKQRAMEKNQQKHGTEIV